jgi:hypothetical protein
MFMETSAKEDRNVTEAFTTIATEMLKAFPVTPEGQGIEISRGKKIESDDTARCC